SPRCAPAPAARPSTPPPVGRLFAPRTTPIRPRQRIDSFLTLSRLPDGAYLDWFLASVGKAAAPREFFHPRQNWGPGEEKRSNPMKTLRIALGLAAVMAL